MRTLYVNNPAINFGGRRSVPNKFSTGRGELTSYRAGSLHTFPGNAVVDDWRALQLNFNRHYENLGSTRERESRDGSETPPEARAPEPSVLELQAVNAPLDRSLPTATINQAVNRSVERGAPLGVPINATAHDPDGDGRFERTS